MKQRFFIALMALTMFSCIDKEQCANDYLRADDWLVEKIKFSGDNVEAQNSIYKQYQDKYEEINSRCK